MRLFLIQVLVIIAASGISFAQNGEMELAVQRGHSGAVLVSAASPDGKVLATAGKDKTIKIWGINNGRELRTLTGHEHNVLDLTFHRDDKFLISSDEGGFVKIWDYEKGELIRSWKAHDAGIIDISFNAQGNLLHTGSRDDQAKLWDWEQNELLHSLQFDGGQRGLKSTFGSDKMIAVSGDNGFTYLYSHDNTSKVDTLRELNYSFCGGCFAEAKFSADGKWLITVADRGPLVLRRMDDLKNKIILEEKVEDFNNIDVSSDGRLLVSFRDRVEVFDIEERRKAVSIPILEKEYNHATFSSDGKSILASSDGSKSLMFSTADGKFLRAFHGKLNNPIVGDLNLDPNSYWESYAYKIAILKSKFIVSPNGEWAVKGRSGNKLIVWDLAMGKPYRILVGHDKAIISFEFSPDGEKLISGDAEGKVIYWDLAKGDTIATRKMHYNMVLCFAFSHNGKLLATGGYDGYLNIIDIENFEVLKRINFSGTKEYFDSPFSLQFAPNDLYITVGSLGKAFKTIEIDTGEEYKSFLGHTNVVSDFAFDEDIMISSSWDGNVKGWDYRLGYQEWKFTASHLPLNDFLLIKEKNWLITGGADREIKIWDLPSKQLFQTLKGHTSQVISLNFLEKENILISSTDNGEVKYWSLEDFTNQTTQYFAGPGDWVIFDSEGYFNATQGAAEAVVFVKGLESFHPGQFFEKFYNPDLRPISQHATRFLDDPALSELLSKSPPPKVEIATPKDGEAFLNPKINVLVKTINTGGGVDEIRVMHNGKIVSKKVDRNSKLQQRGKSMTEVYELELLPGKNIVEASAFNKERLESERARIVVKYNGKKSTSNCFVVAVGINKYKNSQMNLNYARSDAESFVEAIKNSSGELFDKVEVLEFYDKDATQSNILEGLDRISTIARPSDVLCFYYAGHGSMVDNNFYFISSENTRLYDEKELRENAISDEQLRDKLKEIQALKQVVIIDACQSGGGVQTIATRGAGNEKALAQLSRSAGVHVMASAGSEQFASEFKELGHGLFTFALLEAIGGNADGTPKDHFITVFELKSYLDAKVPLYSEEYKGQPQYPFTFSIGQDFPINYQPDK